MTRSRGRCGASSSAASARARSRALSDHLLALRALLEPDGPAQPGALARQLSFLCATEHERGPGLPSASSRRSRSSAPTVNGRGRRGTRRADALACWLADHLRALLRDLICGHLPADLVELAEQIAAGAAELEESTDETTLGPQLTGRRSRIRAGGLAAQPHLNRYSAIRAQAEEILDVLI